MEEDRQQPATGRNRWRTFGLVVWITVKWTFIFGLTIGLFAGGAVTGYVASLVHDEPVRSREMIEERINENAITGFVYFNDGQPVGQLRTEEDRRLIELKDVPQQVIDAVLAIEDNNFKDHFGVDIYGLGRAVKQKLLNEDIQTGGSTLTQQLAKIVFLTAEVTDSRKAREIFLSLRLERFLTKDEILTAYLNKVPYGNGSSGYNLYGIKAAAKGIFNINNLNDLNIAQSAYLAGLPQRPSAYTAFTGRGEFNDTKFQYAIDRQRLVLRRMLETNRIDRQQYEEALAFDIRGSLAAPNKKAYATFPYLMLEAERQAAEILLMQQNPNLSLEDVRKKEHAEALEEVRRQLLRGGYHIHTTIDKKVYNLMREIGTDKNNFTPDHPEKGVEQIAAILIDHKTGAILGMLEGRDFYLEQMNYATQMTRQPGSAMKPISAYLPALEEGFIQPAGIIDDTPIVLKDGQKGFHIPMNSNKRFYGLVTAREALNRSLNIPAMKLFLDEVTIPKAWEFTRKLGITTIQPEDEYAQTGVIGGLSKGVSVEELTNAYGTIPNNGVFNDSYMISKITDANGKVIYEHKMTPQRVFSEQTAFLMTDMLRTVISSPNGTGHRLTSWFKHYRSVPVAGKTGTTQSYGDVWFMGFTPDVTLGVWTGYEKQIHSLSEDGRTRARKIWAQIMDSVVEAKPEWFESENFEQPEGIVKATVSSVSGKKPTELTKQMGKLVTDWFNKDYLPKENDDAIVKMAYITFNGVNYIPQPGTPADFVQEGTMIVRKKPLHEIFEEIKAAQQIMPKSSIRPMSAYMPPDADKDAPSKIDPRVDDGVPPSPPSNVRLEVADTGKAVVVTFNANGEEDVAGYRLYRSLNGKPFEKYGNSLLTGQDRRFVSYVSSSTVYQYYLTAVDVGGRESAPSRVVSFNDSLSILPDAQNIGSESDSNSGAPVETDQNHEGIIQPDNGNDANDELQLPGVPTELKVETTAIGIRLTWVDNPLSDQVSQYNVYYSEKGKNRFIKIGTTTEARFEYVSPLTSGWFRVSAVNEKGESEATAPVQLK
ncbi:transglycosylase domain-containing protein [Paenibacillus tarimensis]